MISKIAVLTSGGDAPGMNAAIRAVTRYAINRGIEVYAVYNGYRGLVENKIVKLNAHDVSEKINRGGTFLGSARLPEFAQDEVALKGVANLRALGIDALVAIGGDGTYRGAQKLSRMGINTIGLPGTIDNDIVSTKYTIGFDTALNTVIDAIDKIRDTSSSHERCSIIEVMGRHCGDIALHAGIATGAEAIITSETGFNEEELFDLVREAKANGKSHVLIVISELLTDTVQLAKNIQANTGFESRTTILGHIQRGGSPSAYDRYLATTMGAYAVQQLIDGTTDACVCTDGIDLFTVPFETALDLERSHDEFAYELAKTIQ